MADLEGGIFFNVGSAVILPEVFLKALALARNLGHTVDRFTTVNLDFIRFDRDSSDEAFNYVENVINLTFSYGR